MTRPDLGTYGLFSAIAYLPAGARDEAAALAQELGFGAIWLANVTVEQAAPVVAATSTVTVGTAIQSIWAQDAATTAAQYTELEAAHPGRFLLGLGVSHPQSTAGYERPLKAMANYLDALDQDPAVPADRRVIAALGPRMLGLAAERSAGSVPYLVTAEQVASARGALGADALLAPELGVVLESDPARARELARGALSRYLPLTNYSNNWLRGGFTPADLADGGSDRLIDALYAWGDDQAIRARIEAFRAAGADHVVLQLIEADNRGMMLPAEGLRRLAALLF